MSLQVRLRHALGDRLIDLPGRAIDEPVAVGRSAAADVQVPSLTVAPRHCVLFVHDGHWAVQDAGGTTGTFVNGRKAEGPTLLRVGDVVTLGAEPNAASLEIEPAKAARGIKDYAMSAVAPVAYPQPTAPAPVQHSAYPHAVPSQPPVAYATPEYASPAGYAPATYPAPPAATGAVDTSGGDAVGWAADVGTSRFYTRRRRRADYSLPLAIFITLLIVGGVAYYARKHWQQDAPVARQVPSVPAPPATATAPTVVPEADVSPAPSSIFNTGKGAAPPTTATVASPPVSPPVPAPAPGATADGRPDVAAVDGGGDETGQDAIDPSPASAAAGGDDPAWKKLQAATFSPDEAKAIVLFEDYARTHPDRNAAELSAFTEKALDRIWFERIEQLCAQRDEVKAKLQETEKDLSAETDEAYKKRVLVPLKAAYEARMKALDDELKGGMQYGAPTDPNLLDEAELGRLRKQRDPAAYAAWKERVLAHIRRTHGQLPWASEADG